MVTVIAGVVLGSARDTLTALLHLQFYCTFAAVRLNIKYALYGSSSSLTTSDSAGGLYNHYILEKSTVTKTTKHGKEEVVVEKKFSRYKTFQYQASWFC